jgi:hypothetical protein
LQYRGLFGLCVRSPLQPLKKNDDFDCIFFLILTTLCVRVKVLFSYFPYCATDLLLFAGGLISGQIVRNLSLLFYGRLLSFLLLNGMLMVSPLEDLGPAGIGGVLRDHMGMVMDVFSISAGVKNSNKAELIAVVKALRLSSLRGDLSNNKIIIESDSSNVVS